MVFVVLTMNKIQRYYEIIFCRSTGDKIVEILLNHNADPNIKDNEGNSPLTLASLKAGISLYFFPSNQHKNIQRK